MSIVKASQEPTILNATLSYLEMGLSVLPVKGKQAAVSWSKFQTERAQFSYVHNWNRAGLLQGVGIIAGAVSNNLAIVDLDGLDSVAAFEARFPELLDTFTVISGSMKGQHLYFYVDELPSTTRTKGFELRVDGCYVVAPPSLHPSGNKYQPNTTEIKRVQNLNQVVTWIRGMIPNTPAPVTVLPPLPAIKNERYGWVALDRECANVRSAPQGTQNAVLNRAAFKLGQLVAAGILRESDVESALVSAAAGLSARDGEHATLKTIKSGLRAGMMKAPVYRRNI